MGHGKKGKKDGPVKRKATRERKMVGPAGLIVPVLEDIGSFSMKSVANEKALATQLVASGGGSGKDGDGGGKA